MHAINGAVELLKKAWRCKPFIGTMAVLISLWVGCYALYMLPYWAMVPGFLTMAVAVVFSIVYALSEEN